MREVIANPISEVLGDLAGMFGTLLGIDGINTLFWIQHLIMACLIRQMQVPGQRETVDDLWDY